jgi:hypothetical protein
MESILWALDLVAVLLLCRWAVAQDAKSSKKTGKRPG